MNTQRISICNESETYFKKPSYPYVKKSDPQSRLKKKGKKKQSDLTMGTLKHLSALQHPRGNITSSLTNLGSMFENPAKRLNDEKHI